MDNFEKLSSIRMNDLNDSDLQKVEGGMGLGDIIIALYSIGIGRKLLEMLF
jgi:hypothetical protein